VDLERHHGVHPRLGALDVVPFVPLDATDLAPPGAERGPPGQAAVPARDRFARFAATALGLPVFVYGPLAAGTERTERTERTLPEIRRRAFVDLAPDLGPAAPDPRRGAVAVGARGPLVAYNVWVAGGDLALARTVATAVRGPTVRALGLAVGPRLQVSTNLVDPFVEGPGQVYDRIAGLLARRGAAPAGGELVGLLPAAVLANVEPARWAELGLSAEAVIEQRLAGAGAEGHRPA
jgi:glutamate formiminotransferase/glutamate formiminotransferase/formiminotetrahydrofolate cyclodeaminase